jgi:dihydrofolate reductase
VLAEVEGDTYLQGFNPDEWVLINESAIYEENGFKYRFKYFQRKQ